MTKEDAEQQIQQILKQLELDSGALVESVDILNIDITGMCDVVKQWQSRVFIVLKPIPGRRW